MTIRMARPDIPLPKLEGDVIPLNNPKKAKEDGTQHGDVTSVVPYIPQSMSTMPSKFDATGWYD